MLTRIAAVSLMTACAGLVACEGKSAAPDRAARRPNVLWIVWDTVRADRLSLYRYPKPTTPRLEKWAEKARVYENCLSTAGSTVPSHASMFTGLTPSEHGVNSAHQWLDGGFTTIAELFHDGGYQTYLWSANPHISKMENFHQGFDIEEHPWDADWSGEALRIVQGKIPPEDRSSELAEKLRAGQLRNWDIKACGELTERGIMRWLAGGDRQRPYFAFLNYMEAHRPFIPPRSYRAKMMPPEQVARSYQVDRSWLPMWEYSFGLRDYSPQDLDVMAGTYDATLAELDDLFSSLMRALGSAGYLENTAVILTADHGELLGEHHMLDHQYSLYDELLRVPLVVFFPDRFPAGREARPVMNFDLFPTLLELAGIVPPPGLKTRAVSLLSPREGRLRLSEYPCAFREPFQVIQQAHPGWDSAPWTRTFRALFDGPVKFIWASDGRHELYRRDEDPDERRDLAVSQPALARTQAAALETLVASLRMQTAARQEAPEEPTEEHIRQLKALGYIAGGGKPKNP